MACGHSLWVPVDLGYGGREARRSSIWRASPSARVPRRPPGEWRRARRRSGLAGKGRTSRSAAASAGRQDILLGQRRVPPYVARRRFARRLSVPSGRQKAKARRDLTPCHFQRIANWGLAARPGSCCRIVRPDQERTKTWGHDVRVLLSTYGDAVTNRWWDWRCGCERWARRCGCARRPTGRSGRPTRRGRQREMRTCPTRGSTELEAPVIRSASAGQRSTAASEVSR